MRASIRGGLLALALLLPAAALSAQQIFDACYVPEVGALYLINLDGLPTACLSETHVAITWTEGAVPDGAVTEAKIADGAVTSAKLGPDVGSTILGDGSVTEAKLADGAVTEAKLAFGAATQAELDAHAAADDHANYLLVDGVREATNGFAVTGTLNSGTMPAAGVGPQLLWYPRKAAFRAGRPGSSQWAEENIGYQSVAMGLSSTASGAASVAMGEWTSATGSNSMAFGNSTTASGGSATAMGIGTTASGGSSTAMGQQTEASGTASTALGESTRAIGSRSIAMGFNTEASGAAATAMNVTTVASGQSSTSMGLATTAQAYASLVIGQYNVVSGTPVGWFEGDPLLVAGNGSGFGSRSNALTLLKNGNLTIAGSLTESSDIRLKEDIEAVESTLDGVLALTPLRYRFREGTGHPTERQIGLSAQQVAELFPELVATDSRGYLSVSYADLAAVLVRAVQEQQEMIRALRAQLQELDPLRQRLRELEGALERLDRLEALVSRPPG